MRNVIAVYYAVLLWGGVPGATRADERQLKAAPADIEFFEKKIRPLLAAKCYSCHSRRAKKLQGTLQVDSRAALLAGGDSGPAIVPGKPAQSLLIAAVQYVPEAEFEMPPQGKLADHEIAALTEWVRRGAPFPGGAALPADSPGKMDFTEARQFWSFVPVQK